MHTNHLYKSTNSTLERTPELAAQRWTNCLTGRSHILEVVLAEQKLYVILR
jgi:hypothetical protein